MAVAPDPEHIDPRHNVPDLQVEYLAGLGYAMRWKVYSHAEDGVDFHELTRRQLDLSDNQSVLDLGCGRAEFLKSFRRAGFMGRLTGVDIDTALWTAHDTDAPIELIEADAGSELNFEDDSFDVVSALFMLYHVPNPMLTLREAARVAKPEGKVLVATSAPNNKPMHRLFERTVAAYLQVEPPPIKSESFDTTVAAVVLPQIFNDVEVITHDAEVVIRPEDTVRDNAPSTKLWDFRDSLVYANPQTPVWASRSEDWVNNIVMPHIQYKIATEGAFVEEIHRKLYICSNPIAS